MRLLLNPPPLVIPVVDVVAVGATEVPIEEWPLDSKTRIVPIILEGPFSRNAQDTDHLASKAVTGAPTPHDDIACFRRRSDLRLACREGAQTMERVWCEPIVTSDFVGKHPHGVLLAPYVFDGPITNQ